MELLFSQNFLFYFSHNLLSSAAQGFGGTSLLLALCFFGVHVAKIIIRGWRLYDKSQETQAPKKLPEQTHDTKSDNKQPSLEPIYYIVEKKRRRSKPSYGEPKEIRFK